MTLTLSTLARVLIIAVGTLNVADIVLHVAVNDVEPLRVTGNLVVIAASIALLMWARVRHALTPIIAAAVSLSLNLVFIALDGIGPLGVLLVVATTLLLVVIALVLRRQRS